MTEKRIKVTDKRLKKPRAGDAASDVVHVPSEEQTEEKAEEKHDYLDDLKRVQAEFDNYRKRVIREQTAMAERASARLVEALLPVLDNFERAIAHGDGGSGVELVYREFRRTLESEGLKEIPAEGVPFDPRVHEAVESVDDPDVDEIVCRNVYRRGYELKDRVLRPAMVVVARPAEPDEAAGGSK